MKFHRVALHTNHLTALQAFYSSILELPVKKDKHQLIIPLNSSELVLWQTNHLQPFYHFAINIPSNKIEEARNWLKTKVELLWMNDYKSDVADFKNWHAKSVYFFDPAGNIVELISRFDLDDAVDEKFSSKLFDCISEIGIVFNENEFDQQTGELMEKFGLNYFSKQPPLKQFRAIGDDEGLFIIVPENRNWYPTNKPAEIYPMQIEFEEDGKRFTLNI
jgi:catechol-2,3-dioxygenase